MRRREFLLGFAPTLIALPVSARAFGLEIPPLLLASADEVIE